jgi:hypothetical protein
MRFSLVLALLVTCPAFAHPVLVQVGNPFYVGLSLQSTYQNQSLQIPPGEFLEFIVNEETDWHFIHGQGTIPVNKLVKLCVSDEPSRSKTLLVCTFEMIQESNGRLGIMRHPVVDTPIPTSVFDSLMSLFYRHKPTLFFAPYQLRVLKPVEPWLLAHFSRLISALLEISKTTPSPFMSHLHQFLVAYQPDDTSILGTLRKLKVLPPNVGILSGTRNAEKNLRW